MLKILFKPKERERFVQIKLWCSYSYIANSGPLVLKGGAFIYKIVDLLFVRAVLPNLLNPLATGLSITNNLARYWFVESQLPCT